MGPEVNELALVIFGAIVAVTLGVTFWAARKTHTPSGFWAAGRRITASQNGLALAGDYMSSSAFLGLTGLLFLFGFDGILIDFASVVAFIPLLLFVAQQLRNVGQYTIGDVLAFRMDERSSRLAATAATVTVTVIYLLALMVSSGVVFSAVAGLSFQVSVLIAGFFTVLYVVAGGMLAATWVQIIKASLLIVATLVVVVLVLQRLDFSPIHLLNEAAAHHPDGEKYLGPGNLFTDPIDGISTILAFALGVLGLPHLLVRFYTGRDGRVARSSLGWAIGIIGTFFLVILIVGYGARAILGAGGEELVGPGGNLTLLVLARELGGGAGSVGGDLLFAFIAATAFTAIIAVVAGLLISASGAIVNDFLLGTVWSKSRLTDHGQMQVARVVAAAIGAGSIVLALAAGPGFNVSILVALAFAVAASANAPALLMALWWKRFNTTGMIVGIWTGLISSVVLILVGPEVWPGPASDAPVSLTNPAIISIPLGILGCVLGSLLSAREPRAERRFEELTVRANVGQISGPDHPQAVERAV